MAMVVRHYGGGGRPRPGECRCATVSFTCEACGLHIGSDETACKHCGAALEGTVDFDGRATNEEGEDDDER